MPVSYVFLLYACNQHNTAVPDTTMHDKSMHDFLRPGTGE